MQFRDAYLQKTQFTIDADLLMQLRENLYIAVASPERVANTICNVSQFNQYTLDQATALAYIGLQDFRAGNGMNNVTVILAKHRTNPAKE